MKARALVLTLCALLAPAAAFAENDQAVLPYDSPVVELLKSIYLEQGKEPLSAAGPYSVDEILLMLEKIDPQALSPAGKRAYDEISAALPTFSPARPMGLGFAWHPAAALEGYFHSNGNPATTKWEYGYNQRQPLVSIPVEAWAGENVYAAMDLSLREVPDTVNPALVPANYANVPIDPSFVDVELPFRAFLALGGHNWSFTFGRDRFTWGSGQTGDLTLSDAPDYYDFMRITGYWRDFKYTAIWVMLYSSLDPFRFPIKADDLAGDPLQTYPRNLILHRIDFCLFDRLSIGLIEGVLIGGVEPKLAYFNPFMILHDLFNFYNASEMFAVEASYNPWQYIEVYGQAAYNQIQSPFEIARYGATASNTPNADAYLGGVRTRVPVWEGYVDGGAEIAYVSPWMYIRENVLTSFEWWRWQASNVPGSTEWVSAPLGYFTGPDAIVFSAWAGYNVPGSFSVSLDYKLAFKGQQTFATPYDEGPDAVALQTPTGVAEKKNVIHLNAGVDVLSFLRCAVDLYGIYTENFGNVSGATSMDFQAVASVRVHF
jgi:hypothetical protein